MNLALSLGTSEIAKLYGNLFKTAYLGGFFLPFHPCFLPFFAP